MTVDVREGGEWSLSQRAKNDVLYCAAIGALGICRVLPRRGLQALGRALGGLAHLLARGERRRARANVVRAMPEANTEEVVRACFRSMGSMLADSVAGLFGPLELLPMGAASRRVIAEAREEGRGVVLPSAHLGPWERVAATLVDGGVPLVTLVRESYDPRFDALLASVRRRGRVRTIPRGNPHAAIQIVRALRAGDVLGAPMDLRSRVPSVVVPFLGTAAKTAIGPARIALRTRAPVVVATLERVSGRLEVTASRVATEGLDELELTARINDELSRRILTAPELWPWMHDRWEVND
jgi:Kdo2-lipid IVA lauroyltransferase/acyltransferase